MVKNYTKENPLRVFTAFSGYDSQCLALNRLGIDYDLVGWSEIDPAAIKAHNALFPQYEERNYGDISKIDWSQVPDFDLFTYSSPCFVEGTLVFTKSGLKRIEEVTENDYVLTHTNTYQKVVTPMVKNHKGEMFNIKAMCFDNLDCTPEHPFYVREMYRKGHKAIRTFRDPIWKQAKDLTKKDYLGVAINTESKLPEWNGVEDNRWGHHKNSNKLSELFTNNSFWYLMGRYIGDGWKKNIQNTSFGVIICCNDSDRDLLSLEKAITDCGFNYTRIKERTVNKLQITSKELYEFVGRYGYYAYGKKIDGETLNLPVEYLKSFIEGYLASDGSYIEKPKLYKINSISRELIYGIAQCVAKVYHTPYKIYYQKRADKHTIEGRVVNQSPQWQIVWKTEKGKQDQAFYEDGYIWCPIRKIETFDADCEVYNMEVENDESYTANGCIVHNCTDFSNAGAQAGGEEGSGTRSSLLWECRKTILAKKPKYLLFENVKALVSDKFLYLFEKWCKELESYGYVNYYQVLNSKDYGVPQSRERIFMVSILKTDDEPDPYYEFPRPVPLTKCVEDILEDNVPEKYYMKQEVTDRYIDIMNQEYPDEVGEDIELNDDSLW